MKANIHPDWNQQTNVICACGNTFLTGSILPQIKVEICYKCHPFYTGTQKFVDTLGQVDKFQKKTEESKKKFVIKQQIKEYRATKVQKATDKPSLKDLLMQARKSSAS